MNAYLRKKKERKNNNKSTSPSAAAAGGGGCPYTVEPGQITKNKSPSATTFKQLFYFCFLPTNTTKTKPIQTMIYSILVENDMYVVYRYHSTKIFYSVGSF